MKKTIKKYQTGGPKVKTPVTDSTAIYKERYKIAKEDFKKNPTQKTADETSKTITAPSSSPVSLSRVRLKSTNISITNLLGVKHVIAMLMAVANKNACAISGDKEPYVKPSVRGVKIMAANPTILPVADEIIHPMTAKTADTTKTV